MPVHTVKKGGNKVRLRKGLIFEGKELRAMYRKPAGFGCMAVGHGEKYLLGMGNVLACLEKDRIGTALGPVQVSIKGHDATHRPIGVCFEDFLTMGSGLLGTGLLDATENGAILHKTGPSWVFPKTGKTENEENVAILGFSLWPFAKDFRKWEGF